MKFMGSKSRIAKYILPVMLKNRKEETYWVEPFVGGGNLIDKVNGNRIGSDIDLNVITALKTIRDNANELPKNNYEFTEQDYKNLKKSKNHKFYSFAGFACSYGAKWLGGWSRDKTGKRDYVSEAYKNALKQQPKLQDVKLVHCPYDKLEIPKDSIIYCDPPYEHTTNYSNNFNHVKFWNWVREKSKDHIVFVSEYSAPSDFECIWVKSLVSSLTKDTGSKKGMEKLFKLKQ